VTGQADWNSGAVATSISTVQTDGSIRTYYGTYYVTNGVLTSADVIQTSGSSQAAPSGNGCGAGLYAGPDTSCSFALNVQQDAEAAGYPYQLSAYSPVTGESYLMTLTSTSPYTYQGGNGALVEFSS
jgi:hypothetical protein